MATLLRTKAHSKSGKGPLAHTLSPGPIAWTGPRLLEVDLSLPLKATIESRVNRRCSASGSSPL